MKSLDQPLQSSMQQTALKTVKLSKSAKLPLYKPKTKHVSNLKLSGDGKPTVTEIMYRKSDFSSIWVLNRN
ncbi:unnamed protein product [Ambrosiozyma monospora]|uniref:Unnamed protein product n=1 Tax=Ambrosiozyma monospora TaxID=43982 RepID=A0ACB5T352_AMBMO|nr:unnamed protein product [Ambrosiozyma monospora]